MKNKIQGFSLIELMIALVVAGILAAIAIPSYQNSVLKGNRSVGKSELTVLLSKQEQYFVNNKSYATDLTKLGYPAAPYYVDNNGNTLASSTGAVYQIALASGASASAFTANAVPQNNQVNDSPCATLSITHRGAESATGSHGSACW